MTYICDGGANLNWFSGELQKIVKCFPRRPGIGGGLALLLLLTFQGGCATLADWTAPRKAAAMNPDKALGRLEQEFWDALHKGEYGKISELIARYKAIYSLDPNQAKAAVRLGFLHVWRLSERNRLKTIGPEIIDDATLCKNYFGEAFEMIPEDARLAGFFAACSLAEADINKNERSLRRGYFAMVDAVDQWPEFNAFTAGYVLSKLAYTHERYDEAVEFQWQVLDECYGEKVDRQNFNMNKYMKMEIFEGPKRVCWNSTIAPHNFEGFFLNMGDMLVKQGDVKKARMIYKVAQSSKDYQRWPYKHVLESRLVQTEKLVKPFRRILDSSMKPHGPVMMFHSDFACMGCHQGHLRR